MVCFPAEMGNGSEEVTTVIAGRDVAASRIESQLEKALEFRKLLRKYGFREFINPEMTTFTSKGDVAAFKLDYKKQQSVTLNTHQYTCQIFQTGSAKVMGHKWAQGYQRWPTNTRVGLHEFSDQLRQG
ncbi:uncharacterized protein [Rutidosis leptorrhynchoides]|uniref:uncharacterized protein isoform X2 n=1 Tax=Rutidosis leptorrhynchoides TaxID=125765 RepID=UPI003A993002